MFLNLHFKHDCPKPVSGASVLNEIERRSRDFRTI